MEGGRSHSHTERQRSSREMSVAETKEYRGEDRCREDILTEKVKRTNREVHTEPETDQHRTETARNRKRKTDQWLARTGSNGGLLKYNGSCNDRLESYLGKARKRVRER